MTASSAWRRVCVRPAQRAVAVTFLLRRAVLAAMEHDALTLAQAVAYAAVVALFPTLIVAAAVVALLPDTAPFRLQMSLFFDRVLPSNVSPLLEAYFATTHKNPQTARALVGSVVVSITGASSVMSVLMEGFRRAHEMPLERGSFWRRRGRALALVPISLVPMTVASLLVVFGHFLSSWLAGAMAPELRTPVFLIAFALRWTVALAGSVTLIAVIYHLGTDPNVHMREHLEPWLRDPLSVFRKEWSWRASLPGATVATLLWFATTLGFGWYVTRFANYGQVYGSLGAGIALMFWLYIIALSVLMGAEFNAQYVAAARAAEAEPELPGECSGDAAAALHWESPAGREAQKVE